MKKLIIILLLLFLIPFITQASILDTIRDWFAPKLAGTVLYPSGGGLGTSTKPTAGQIPIGMTNGLYNITNLTAGTNITISTSSGGITINSSGGSGGGGEWSTSTGLLYTIDIVLVGGSATTVGGYAFEVTGNSYIPGYATSGALTSYFTLSGADASNSAWIADTDSWPASSTNWANWNTAYASSLTAIYSETDPKWVASSTSYFTIVGANASNSAWLSDVNWNGGNTGLVVSTGRTSLALQDSAWQASTTWPTLIFANTNYLSTSSALTNYVSTSTLAGYSYASTGALLSSFGGAVTDAQVPDTITIANNATTGTIWTDASIPDTITISNNATTGTVVSSLNSFTGTQRLWGDSPDVTITASGTAGLVFDIPNNATTGVQTLSSLTSIGTIGTGVWQGTSVKYNYGGTGTTTALALWNLWRGDGAGNLVQVASSVFAGSDATAQAWATTASVWASSTAGAYLTRTTNDFALDAEISSSSKSIVLYNASDTLDGVVQIRFPYAVTLTKVICSTNASASSTIQFDERAGGTPNTAGTDVMTAALVCDSDSASTTAFANSGIAVDAPLSLDVDTITGTVSALRIHLYFYPDD